MVQWCMLKTEAIKLLGGSIASAAEAIGVTYQAVDKWPAELPPRIADRVHAALWRQSQDATVKRLESTLNRTEPSEAPAGAAEPVDPYSPAHDETVKRLMQATKPLARRRTDRDGPGARDERLRGGHAGSTNRERHPS
jgi:hypothetical protein